MLTKENKEVLDFVLGDTEILFDFMVDLCHRDLQDESSAMFGLSEAYDTQIETVENFELKLRDTLVSYLEAHRGNTDTIVLPPFFNNPIQYDDLMIDKLIDIKDTCILYIIMMTYSSEYITAITQVKPIELKDVNIPNSVEVK